MQDRPQRKRGGAGGRRGISGALDCISVARDRNRQTIDAGAGCGAVNKARLERHLLWLMPFHGVASRYLPNYLGWRRMLDGGKIASADQLLRLAIETIHIKR